MNGISLALLVSESDPVSIDSFRKLDVNTILGAIIFEVSNYLWFIAIMPKV